jgi:hypothetical protein
VTRGIAKRFLKHTIDSTDLVKERTPEVVLQTATIPQIDAAHKYATIKQTIVDWEIRYGPKLANMHLAQGHLDEQIEVEGELTKAEREVAILDAASLKLEIVFFKKELSARKKQKTELSQRNTAAKVGVNQSKRCDKIFLDSVFVNFTSVI